MGAKICNDNSEFLLGRKARSIAPIILAQRAIPKILVTEKNIEILLIVGRQAHKSAALLISNPEI